MKNMKKRTFNCLFIFLILVGIGGYIFVLDMKRKSISLNDNNINIEVNTNEWTREDLPLIVKYNGNIKDIKEYSYDGGKTWTKSNKYAIEKNDIVKVFVKDINDKIYRKDIIVTKIDKTGPVVLLEDNVKVSRFSKVDINNFVTVYDEGIGVRDEIVYTPIALDTSILGEQKIYVYTIDKLANKTIKQITFEVVPKADYILAKDINLNHKIMIVKMDEQSTLEATITPKSSINKKVVWTSSDPNIVSVDIYGNIKGVSQGSATITATTSNGLTTTCEIIVK